MGFPSSAPQWASVGRTLRTDSRNQSPASSDGLLGDMSSTTTLAATEPAAAQGGRRRRATRVLDPLRLGPNQRQALSAQLRELVRAAHGQVNRRDLYRHLFQRSAWARIGLVTDLHGRLTSFASVHVSPVVRGGHRSLEIQSACTSRCAGGRLVPLRLAARWGAQILLRHPTRGWDHHTGAIPGAIRMPLEPRALAAAGFRLVTSHLKR